MRSPVQRTTPAGRYRDRRRAHTCDAERAGETAGGGAVQRRQRQVQQHAGRAADPQQLLAHHQRRHAQAGRLVLADDAVTACEGNGGWSVPRWWRFTGGGAV